MLIHPKKLNSVPLPLDFASRGEMWVFQPPTEMFGLAGVGCWSQWGLRSLSAQENVLLPSSADKNKSIMTGSHWLHAEKTIWLSTIILDFLHAINDFQFDLNLHVIGLLSFLATLSASHMYQFYKIPLHRLKSVSVCSAGLGGERILAISAASCHYKLDGCGEG